MQKIFLTGELLYSRVGYRMPHPQNGFFFYCQFTQRLVKITIGTRASATMSLRSGHFHHYGCSFISFKSKSRHQRGESFREGKIASMWHHFLISFALNQRTEIFTICFCGWSMCFLLRKSQSLKMRRVP